MIEECNVKEAIVPAKLVVTQAMARVELRAEDKASRR